MSCASWGWPSRRSLYVSMRFFLAVPTTGTIRRYEARRFASDSPDAAPLASAEISSITAADATADPVHTRLISSLARALRNALRERGAILSIALGADIDDHPGRCDRRESERIPVGEMNAALRFGSADLRRLRRSMYSVVRLRKPHPDHPDRIVGPRRDVRLYVVALGPVNERRIVRKYGIPDFGRDLELTHRDSISRPTEA